jgi:hypothetical protein
MCDERGKAQSLAEHLGSLIFSFLPQCAIIKHATFSAYNDL